MWMRIAVGTVLGAMASYLMVSSQVNPSGWLMAAEATSRQASGKEEKPMTTPAGSARTVKFKGNPLTLMGTSVEVGQMAPDFAALGNDLGQVRLSDYKGKVVLLVAVPSLDTPVCDTETRRFNQEAASLGEDVAILTLSMDLPFAQSRWCGAAGVERVKTLSDHREGAFGLAYGVLIRELRLLSRSVFVVDRKGKIVYKEEVSEITNEPNYQAALEAARKAL